MSDSRSDIIVSGSFDKLQSREMRFIQEAAKHGRPHVLLWSDAAVAALAGDAPQFPQAERRYMLESLRGVDQVTICDPPMDEHALPEDKLGNATAWIVMPSQDHPDKLAYCRRQQLDYRCVNDACLAGFPLPEPLLERKSSERNATSPKRVLVTGCYDWFHSGHVRFFEEVSAMGDLYVVVGSDENIRRLKGEGHPLFPADERQYMVASIRFVKQALVSSGCGWLDAEPEIEHIQPDIYAVNEDGDRPEKRDYCAAHGIDYRVLKRTPKPGLPARQSTALRGF